MSSSQQKDSSLLISASGKETPPAAHQNGQSVNSPDSSKVSLLGPPKSEEETPPTSQNGQPDSNNVSLLGPKKSEGDTPPPSQNGQLDLSVGGTSSGDDASQSQDSNVEGNHTSDHDVAIGIPPIPKALEANAKLLKELETKGDKLNLDMAAEVQNSDGIITWLDCHVGFLLTSITSITECFK